MGRIPRSTVRDVHVLETGALHTPMSDADRQQGELFAKLLAEYRLQITSDIRDTIAELTDHPPAGDPIATRRLQRVLAQLCSDKFEIDRLSAGLQLRSAVPTTENNGFTRYFDIVIKRRRAGWRLEIPEFGVALAHIESRSEAEEVGKTVLSAITGLPINTIAVRPVLARRIG